MTTIVTRSGKGSPLTHTEVDTNFTNLNTAKLEAGAIALGSAATPSISFTGDTNTGIYSPGADQVAISTNGTGRLFVDASGRIIVGAATAAIGIPLEIVSNATGLAVGVRGRSADNIGIIGFYPNNSSTEYVRIQSNGDSSLSFGTGSSGTERLRITSAGLVGIGTSSPTELLDIDGDGDSYLRWERDGAGGGYSAITSGGVLRIGPFFSATDRELALFTDNANDSWITTGTAQALKLGTNKTARITINSSGNVGIGTTSPAYKLDIFCAQNDGLQIYETSSGNNRRLLITQSANGVFYNATFSTGLNAHVWGIGGGEVARIDSSGRLLVGTSSASGGNLLQVNSDALIYGITVGRGAGAISSNTAIGNGALQANTTGIQNTANGLQALYSNTTGIQNTANGYAALVLNTTGAGNTANGLQALYSNTTGANNTANGLQALYSNTTGAGNIANGLQALFSNTTGNYNTANGYAALFSNTTGAGNIGVGGVNSSGTYAPVFSTTTENNRIVMGSTAVTNAYVQVAWTVVSDKRDKTNFTPVPHGLDFVNALKPTAYQFKYDRDSTETNGPVRYGFLAQDILELEGQNSVIIDAEDPEKLRYNGESLVPVLVNAVQELTAMVKDLQDELSILKGAQT